MGLVLEGLFALAVVLALVWLWTVRGSVGKDVDAARQQAVQVAQGQERAAREARLYQPGISLRCLGCDARFLGPLGETGCPQCHLASLVVTEDEFERGRQASGRRPEGNTDGDANTPPGSSGRV